MVTRGDSKGNDIPLCGRIVAVADVYDALTTRRVYKPAFSHQKAREIILEGSGNHFDPVIVQAFLDTEEAFLQVKNQCDEQPESRTLSVLDQRQEAIDFDTTVAQ